MNRILFIFLVIVLSFSANSQNNNQRPLPIVKYNDNVNLPLSSKEKSFIDEVYGDEANKNVYSKKHRLKGIKNILRNRVIIFKLKDESEDKGYPKLSEVPVFNSFVPSLKRDKNFNPDTFNPLKYQFKFYSRGSYTYRVDNTDYLIIIKSQHY